VNSYSYSIQFRESAFRPPPMLLLCCHYSCRILSFSSAFLWWWLRNGENQPYECSAFRHQRTLKLAPFEPQKENAGGSIGVYFFYFSRVFFLRNQLPTNRLLHTNKTEDIKKHLMTYQTLFCSDGGGWADAGARAQVVVRRSPADKETAAKDVRYLVNAHSTRQDISPPKRHTLLFSNAGNRGNAVGT
jgi:hypothetical protein